MRNEMKQMNSTQIQFALRTYQASMFWLPAAILALFVIMVGIFGKNMQAVKVSTAYIGVVLPLIGGILGAYAILDDPVLELHFASPRSAFRMITERLVVILMVLTVCAVAFQVFVQWIGLDLSEYGSLWQRQAAWIVPCVAMTLLGFVGAFASAQSTTGAMLVGMIWIVQVIAREWFLNTPLASNFFLFTGALYPHVNTVVSSQITLAGLSLVLLGTGWCLFQKQERYI
jgi:hypothetical protein